MPALLRSPAVPNDVRAHDSVVPLRSLGRCPDPSAFPAVLQSEYPGGDWFSASLRPPRRGRAWNAHA